MSDIPLKQLTDSSNNNFYPATSSSGVYRPDSSTVETSLVNLAQDVFGQVFTANLSIETSGESIWSVNIPAITTLSAGTRVNIIIGEAATSSSNAASFLIDSVPPSAPIVLKKTAELINASTITTSDAIPASSLQVGDLYTLVFNGQFWVVEGVYSNQKITGNDIAQGTITSANISSSTITSSNIAQNTITGSNIAQKTITNTNINFDTIGAKYEGGASGYQGSGTNTINVGTFSVVPSRLYLMTFAGGAWASNASGVWRVRTGSYSGTQIWASGSYGVNQTGQYVSSSSPFLYTPTEDTVLYVTFQPFTDSEWSIECHMFSFDSMTNQANSFTSMINNTP